jgi:predicted aspartyl protease
VTWTFNHLRGLIHVRALLLGPTGSMVARLALDTGATGTTINIDSLEQIGYDPTRIGRPVQARTASGVVQTHQLPVHSVSALGQTRTNFTVAACTLPPGVSVDGLLGLDFFRGHILNIDFTKGEITLNTGGTP